MWKPKILRRTPKPIRLELDELMHKDFIVSTRNDEFMGRVMSVTYSNNMWEPVSKQLTIKMALYPND